MENRNNKEIVDFFKKLIKSEIDGGVWILSKRLERIKTKHKSVDALKKWDRQQYDDLLKITQFSKDEKAIIFRLLQSSVSTAFYYFFKRLEEGENIERGERISFELTAINENTGQKTKLISANLDEDDVFNDFQEWILDNCSNIEDNE